MPKKIFELAKDLGIGALDLVEELKAQGFTVRNHMSSLADEDVEKFLASREKAPAKKDVKAKQKVKKKTVKKKVVKKKSSKIETVASDSEADVKTSDKKTEGVVVKKKKSVIRKKSTSLSDNASKESVLADAKSDEGFSGSSSTISANEEKSSVSGPEVSKKDEKGGLRVVSRPKVEDPVKETVAESNKENELYKEKMHRFTPVFIPEEKPELSKPGTSSESLEEQGTGPENKSDYLGEELPEKKSDQGKKRLGGLATMMSGKKSINKSKVLTETRAESELKSYAALSGSGRPIYTTIKKKRAFGGQGQSTEITEVKDSKRVVKIHQGVTAVELAKKLKVKFKELVDKVLDINLLLKQDDYLGLTLASEITALYDFRVENIAFDEEKVIGKKELSEEDLQKLPLRDPVITIMGHVDHGKTTLLDYIREEKVASGEAGGITQHIGAYSVKTNSGKNLTFLDTPGHAAFGSMRQRGANITDIVILVVAADDGVMPQTVESIKYIQNAGCPLIVAINKMDKEGANPDRIKQELANYSITPEDWGGDTMMIPISALKGEGIEDLLESVALQAEMLDLRASDKGAAEGIVIESKIEPGRGPVATVLVTVGTLKKGNNIVVGETYGRARSLVNCSGKDVKTAGPSAPVQILGLDAAPSPGDSMNVVKNEREAKGIAQNRIKERKKLESMPVQKQVSLEDFFAQSAEDINEVKTLSLIVRSDVQGSFEAIKQSLLPLSNSEVEVKLISGGVGPITESDVQLADSSGGIIIGFNMRPLTNARRVAEQKGIDVKTYSIIYELINDVKLAIEGMLDPSYIETFIGRAEVKDTFVVPRVGTIAGCQVIDGSIKVGCQIRLLRDGKIMFDGKLNSLKRFKDDVKEVKNGYECGMGLEGYNDLKQGDLFEAYIMEEQKRTLKDVGDMPEMTL